jgi:hypothetical protein
MQKNKGTFKNNIIGYSLLVTIAGIKPFFDL